MHRLRLLARLCFVAILPTLSAADARSEVPKTVKIIVPSTPGGGADILARLLAEQITRAGGATMIVENRPGAGTTIGTEAASRAMPDGGTLLITTPEFVINAHLPKLSYDPLTSFEPICYLVRSPQLIVVRSDAPTARSLIWLRRRAQSPASSRLPAPDRHRARTSRSRRSSARSAST